MRRLFLAVLLVAACGTATPASPSAEPTPRPTVRRTQPPAAPTPTPAPTEAPVPPDKALVALAPKEFRSACRAKDLSDAPKEIVCVVGNVDFYLARWPSVAGVKADLAESLKYAGCLTLDKARGDYLVGKTRVGQGGGCSDSPEFYFTNEKEKLSGTVTVLGGTLEDSQAWFVENGPIGKGLKGKVTGEAVGPVLRDQSWAVLVKHAKRVPYKTFFRNSGDYEGRLVYFQANVFQVTDWGLLVQVTKDRYGYWDDLVFINNSRYEQVLEDDIVEFVGIGEGLYEYTSVLGTSERVPQVKPLELRIK